MCDLRTRQEIVAQYIIDTNCTIRECARHFGYSKSTIHLDVSKRLKDINTPLYDSVCKVLSLNFSERHLRGGIATKRHYELLRANNSK